MLIRRFACILWCTYTPFAATVEGGADKWSFEPDLWRERRLQRPSDHAHLRTKEERRNTVSASPYVEKTNTSECTTHALFRAKSRDSTTLVHLKVGSFTVEEREFVVSNASSPDLSGQIGRGVGVINDS